jgi:hypothetical protein
MPTPVTDEFRTMPPGGGRRRLPGVVCGAASLLGHAFTDRGGAAALDGGPLADLQLVAAVGRFGVGTGGCASVLLEAAEDVVLVHRLVLVGAGPAELGGASPDRQGRRGLRRATDLLARTVPAPLGPELCVGIRHGAASSSRIRPAGTGRFYGATGNHPTPPCARTLKPS